MSLPILPASKWLQCWRSSQRSCSVPDCVLPMTVCKYVLCQCSDQCTQSVQFRPRTVSPKVFFKVVSKSTDWPTNQPTYLSLDASLPKHRNWCLIHKQHVCEQTFFSSSNLYSILYTIQKTFFDKIFAGKKFPFQYPPLHCTNLRRFPDIPFSYDPPPGWATPSNIPRTRWPS